MNAIRVAFHTLMMHLLADYWMDEKAVECIFLPSYRLHLVGAVNALSGTNDPVCLLYEEIQQPLYQSKLAVAA